MAAKTFLAFDLGAESGRAISGTWDGAQLAIEQLHRFPNRPVRVHNHLYWDILALQANLEDGLAAHAARHGTDLASLGIDTWGVDFALLDRDDTLAGLPHHYRDRRTSGMIDVAFGMLPREAIFELTGVQFIEINTLYQLLAMRHANAAALASAKTLLMIPDLFNFWLSGVKTSEWTIASTTQMTDPRTRQWSRPLLDALDLPFDILPPIVEPGTVLGTLLPSVASRTGFAQATPQIIAPASHDTGSAIAAVPATTPNFGYISSGTWSLVGVEAHEPAMGAAALRYNFTNEGGIDNTYRVLKNISGLWLVQECRRSWARNGTQWSYGDLTEHAAKAPAFRSLLDPAHPSLVAPDDMPTAIQERCAVLGQPIPDEPGAFVRCALESLALAYRQTFDQLAEVRGIGIDSIHIVGGGSQNRLLCQFTADACGVPVIAGPVEATALGNLLVQMIAHGTISSLTEAREIVRRSAPTERFEPTNHDAWNDAYGRFLQLANVAKNGTS
jgi:rhamnulokinase